MSADSIDGRALGKAFRQVASAIKTVVKLCPDLHSTRFVKLADFYTLAVLVGTFLREGLILTDSHRNRLAADLLGAFGRQVDDLRLRQRKLETVSDSDTHALDYARTILAGTDQLHQRKRRSKSSAPSSKASSPARTLSAVSPPNNAASSGAAPMSAPAKAAGANSRGTISPSITSTRTAKAVAVNSPTPL